MLTGEAARELGVSEQTVRNWADDGRLPSMTTSNGTRVFQRKDVLRLKEQRDEKKAD